MTIESGCGQPTRKVECAYISRLDRAIDKMQAGSVSVSRDAEFYFRTMTVDVGGSKSEILNF